MSPKTFGYLLKSKAIQSAVLSQNLTANVFVTRQTVTNVLQNLLGLRVLVYRKQYRENQKSDPAAYYPDDYVTLVPSGKLGTVWRGTTPEEADLMAKRDADVYIVDNGIAVNRIITSHSVNTEIYASEIVLPSFERMDDVYLLKVA